MPRKAFVLLSAVSLSVAACARPIVSSTAYGSLPPKASVDDVQVFTDVRPQRVHTEIGVLDVRSFGITSERDYGQMIVEARRRAARMGADGIIVTRRPQESTTTVGSMTRRRDGHGVYTETTSTQESPRVSVVAIVWSDGVRP
jgi:hypothetical protein